MSRYSIPENIIPDEPPREKMNEQMAVIMPKDFAGAVNLMAHPLAGAAAFSALGFGLASQAFGFWAGAISGAAEASQRLFTPILDDIAPRVNDFAEKPKSPAVRAKAATKALIAGARIAAKEVGARAPRNVAAETTADAAEMAVETAVAMPVVEEPQTELMPEDFRQPKALDRPEMPNDLKLISGIGPKLEQVLNGLGVWTYAQIAGWGREEIAWVDDYLSFKGRIGRDGWIGQAAKLAASEAKH